VPREKLLVRESGEDEPAEAQAKEALRP